VRLERTTYALGECRPGDQYFISHLKGGGREGLRGDIEKVFWITFEQNFMKGGKPCKIVLT
jgi:hypothetical protein